MKNEKSYFHSSTINRYVGGEKLQISTNVERGTLFLYLYLINSKKKKFNATKNPIDIFFKHRVLWHILFWSVCYLFYSIAYGSYNEMYRQEFAVNAYLLPARIVGTYAFIYLILPFLLIKRQYVYFAFLTLIHAFAFGMLLWLTLLNFAYCPGCIYDAETFYPIFYWPKILGNLIGNYAIPATAAAIVIFKKYYRDQLYQQELEKGKIEAELKYLKAQIHPHFLFNTLNNLYALTLKKSDKTPDIVLRLSEMLDYMLYNSDGREVKLEDEIKHIKAYLEIEKLRYGDRLNLEVNIKGNTKGKYIAPLLLLPFVENSFKHGASEDMDQCFINIEMNVQESSFHFTVINSYKEQGTQDRSEGIGLENAKRRLELVYPERHKLNIDKAQSHFKITLDIFWDKAVEQPKNTMEHEDPVFDS